MKTIIIDGIEYIPKIENQEIIIQEIPAQTIKWGKSSEETMTWEESKEWCEKQGGRLPTKKELAQAYKDKVEGFKKAYYWSSTEYSTSYGWRQSFDTGARNISGKYNTYYVRCVIGGGKLIN